jgi:hypothetical protein
LLGHTSFFRDVEQKIIGQKCLSADDLLEARREGFDRLSRSVLESLFDEWLVRLSTCIDYEGSYLPKD